ncbi:hypothetical protein AB0N92_05095 [Streptomyces sp. NPDC093248]|uniref:Rv1733c family protein n=1 Tax=Streptomyces sp. NPDC093248 TaxID=3155072 RepID=UPI00341DD7AE
MAGRVPPSAQRPPEDLPRVALWRLRANPLRRRSDLLQGWLGIGLLAAVLVAAPVVALLTGDAARRHYARTAQHQAETWRPATAVLLRDVPRHPEPGSAEARRTRYPARVLVDGPGGRTRTVRTEVEPGLRVGSTVRVWADRNGEITGAPLTAAEIRSRGMGWAVCAVLATAGAGAAAYGTAALAVRRHNLAAWDAAWARTAPRWTPSP